MRFVDAPTPASAGAPTRGADPGAEPRWVEPTHRLGSGSHLVASLSAAEALAVVGEHVPEVALGDPVGLIALSAPAAPGGASRPTAPSRPPTRTGP